VAFPSRRTARPRTEHDGRSAAQVLTEDGAINRFVNVYLNDEDVRFPQSLDTPLDEGDVLSILPTLAGGGR